MGEGRVLQEGGGLAPAFLIYSTPFPPLSALCKRAARRRGEGGEAETVLRQAAGAASEHAACVLASRKARP